MSSLAKVTIYTDGACSGNPGPGGWAAVMLAGEHRKEISGYEPDTTNNRMELTAVLMALTALKRPCDVDVYTDSAYVCNAFLRGWTISWQANGWRNSKKEPVENKDLWQRLISVMEEHRVHWHKVAGHADSELNNRCDELARGEIKKHKTNT